MVNPGGHLQHPQLSGARLARLEAQVEEVLTDPALSDDDVDALMESVVAASVSPPKPRTSTRARVMNDEEAAGPEWAADQFPSAPPPKPTSALSGGGGTIAMPSTSWATPDVEDDDDEKYPLWRPPPRPPLDVPADVADIAPVTPSPPPVAADSSEAQPADPPPPSRPQLSGATGSRFAGLRRRWSTLPPWAKVAVAVAVVLVLLVGQQISSQSAHRRDAARRAVDDGPPATDVAPSVVAGRPAEVTLQPGCPPNAGQQCRPVDSSCGAGSSDPSLAFGSDPSQAWICARSHNIDQQQITIQFPKPVVVTSICVQSGFVYVEKNGQDHFLEHRVPTGILWRIGGMQMEHSINPDRQCSPLKVPGIATQIITGTIQSSVRPPATTKGSGKLGGLLGGVDSSKVDETDAISKITITGYPAGQT